MKVQKEASTYYQMAFVTSIIVRDDDAA